MSNELEIKEKLIDNYQQLMDIRALAVEENAVKTLQRIDREIEFIKLKLDPLELPE